VAAAMTEPEILAEGALHGMRGELGAAVRYALEVGNVEVELEARLGAQLRIESLRRVTCRNCGTVTERRYGDGYCYRCFSTLARCDLCVVSPDRCHYAEGTCREPEWGETFCMRPHAVYLANSGGAKVGIARLDNVPGRFIDQGASAAMVVMTTATRQQAGFVEKAIARHLREQSDWRAIAAQTPIEIDLEALLKQLRRAAAAALEELDVRFPHQLKWVAHPQRLDFSYPTLGRVVRLEQLRLDPERALGGALIGVRGPYLLFEQGLFNVRAHSGEHVRIVAGAPDPLPTPPQMELFR
jgi:uncharacterized protein DUF2797